MLFDRTLAPAPAKPRRVITAAEWAPEYGDPHQAGGEAGVEATPCEPFAFVPCPVPDPRPQLAFVDGVRQVEAQLYVGPHFGLAGVLAAGAVTPTPQGLRIEEVRVQRLTIVGGNGKAELPPQPGGWQWEAHSIEDPGPDAPLQELQRRMREQELELALHLTGQGLTVVLDGPLSAGAAGNLVGYVKTQAQRLLPQDLHDQVGDLPAHHRTTHFTWSDRTGCYLRLVPPPPGSHPWFGIVRLETGGDPALLHTVGGALQAFAGVSHIDPRAPQNLQAVAGLEKEMRRRCGDRALGTRAVRAAVRSYTHA